jgi:predicted P-loop ATPase
MNRKQAWAKLFATTKALDPETEKPCKLTVDQYNKLAENESELIEGPGLDTLDLLNKAMELLAEYKEDGGDLDDIADLALLLSEDEVGKLLLAAKSAPNRCKGELEKAIREARIRQRRKATEARGLIADKTGAPIQNYENIRRVLTNDEKWEGTFWANLFDGHIWIDKPIPGFENDEVPRRFEDADTLMVMSSLQSEEFTTIKQNTVYEAIQAASLTKRRHPVQDYLNGLTWDNTERLPALFSGYFNCECFADIPGYEEYLCKAGIRFAIGAVARVMDPGCKLDHMPTLNGGQGKFKSTGFRVLCGDAWFGDDMPKIDHKDAKDWLRGKWFGEVAEMAAMSGREVEHIKAFLSTKTDDYRKAYGKTAAPQPRQIVLCGTMNTQKYLMDETGGRRFWPLQLKQSGCVDVAGLKRDRDQLWAEAVVRYRRGEQWWFDEGECEALSVAQEDARFSDIGEEQVREYLMTLPDRVEITAGALAMRLFTNEPTGSPLSRRVSRYIKAAGWEFAGKTGGSARYTRGAKADPYYPPSSEAANNVIHMKGHTDV